MVLARESEVDSRTAVLWEEEAAQEDLGEKMKKQMDRRDRDEFERFEGDVE